MWRSERRFYSQLPETPGQDNFPPNLYDMMFFFKVKVLTIHRRHFGNVIDSTQLPRPLIFEGGPSKSSKFKVIRMSWNFVWWKGIVCSFQKYINFHSTLAVSHMTLWCSRQVISAERVMVRCWNSSRISSKRSPINHHIMTWHLTMGTSLRCHI